MKRIYSLLLVLLLSLCLCSCGGNSESTTTAEPALSDAELPAESSSEPVSVSPSAQQEASSAAEPSEAASETETEADEAAVDVDLTDMSSTMIYSEVYNMVVNDPESYMGKTVKMQGMMASYDANPDPALNLGVDYFFAVVVEDATACCQQGLEFVWEGHDTPDDFPLDGTVVTVTGVFDSYDVGGLPMYHIVASSVEVDS